MAQENKTARSNQLTVGFGIIILLTVIMGVTTLLLFLQSNRMADRVLEIEHLIDEFLDAQIVHYEWIFGVEDFLRFDSITTLNVETDGHKCDFGLFVHSERLMQEVGEFPRVIEIVRNIEQLHLDIHREAIEVENRYNNISPEAAEDYYYNTVKPRTRTLMDGIANIVSELEKEEDIVYNEYRRLITITTITIITITIITILASVIVALVISKLIMIPINKLAHIISDIAKGKLNVERVTRKSKDGIGILAESTNTMVDFLIERNQIMKKIAMGNTSVKVRLASDDDEVGKALQKMVSSLQNRINLMKKIATGNIANKVKILSKEDEFGESIAEMVKSLNSIIIEINDSIEQITNGADQVSDSSQSISEGASNQASSLEEITASLSEISNQVQSNTESAVKVSKLADTSQTNSRKGNSQMKEMVKAMEEINKSAKDINEIVKVIDEIAFQTNILALNADIEAARVGKYGKGFAVVAQSVRTLARRSGDSVKETTAIVEKTLKNIDTANKLVHQTAQQLENITTSAEEVNTIAEELAEYSQEQTRGIEQINTALEQVENVVQTNTANAEENASTSEELASQAKRLKEIIEHFTFDRHNSDVYDYSQLTEEDGDNLLESVSNTKQIKHRNTDY